MKKVKTPKSLIQWMIAVVLYAILFVGLSLSINTGIFLEMRINTDYREIARSTSIHIANMLDTLSDGAYSYDPDTKILRKGDVVITDAAFVKSLEVDENIHHTIFWDKTRVITDVVDDKGKLVTGTTLTDEKIVNAVAKEGIYIDNNVTIYGSKYSVCYYPLKNGKEIVGYVFTGVNQNEANRLALRDFLLAAAITLVFAVVIIFIVRKLVQKRSLSFLADLNSAADIAEDKRKTVSSLGDNTSENMGQINLAIGQMSTAVTQQASNTENIMRIMAEFSLNLENIMGQVSDTSAVTSDSTAIIDKMKSELIALEEATKANSEEIVNITRQIEEDTKTVDSISQIVKVINDIAFQITILSFNATVEAVRAGEAGKGFAVVAGNIKELSGKTQNSVNDVSEIIESINTQMKATGRASEELMVKNDNLVQALAATKERMAAVTGAFDKITNSITSIQNNSEQIVDAKNRIAETLSSLAATSEQNAAMSEEVAATSAVVIKTTEELKNEIALLHDITETIDKVKSNFV